MNFDFEKDVLNWSNRAIYRLGHEPSGMSVASSRLSQVFNILRNRIPPIPRAIKVATGFYCPQNHLNGYKQVIFEIERGDDLMPRCSRLQVNKSGYLDLMLLDWGIHHLHLGTENITKGKTNGLIQGHKEILFVFITNDTAYIIGIFDHSSWTKQAILYIVHDAWPHLLKPWKLNGALDLALEPTDEDRKSLRGAYVNSPFKIRNNVYFGPGGGITSAGTGANEIHKANIVLRAADDLSIWVNENVAHIENSVNSKLGDLSFDVSRYILSKTFSISAPQNNARIFVPSTEPAGSLVHPAQASSIEPIADYYSYHEPGSFSDIMVEKLGRI